MSKPYAELREVAQRNVQRLGSEEPGAASLLLLWNKGERTTQVAIAGEIEPNRDIVRMLREVADKLEKDAKKLIILPH